MAEGVLRDRRTWVLAAITLGTVLVGWLLKEPCIGHDWTHGWPFSHHCYTDVQALYQTRGAADGSWPYAQTFNEYPVLTGLFMHVVGAITTGKFAYVATTAAILGLLAIATTLLLADLVGPTRAVLYWAVAPAVALYFVYNWDLLAVAFAVAGLSAYRRSWWAASGILIGLGACAKLWPAFMLPALGLALLRRQGGLDRHGWAFGAGAVLTIAALNGPFLLANPHLFLQTYSFQLSRGPNFESPWYALAHLGREWRIPWMDAMGHDPLVSWESGLPILAAFLVSGWAAWTRRLDAVAAAAIPVLAFLAFNKVFSLQYTLWALPLLLLTKRSVGQRVSLVVADLAVFTTLFAFFAVQDITQDAALFFPVVVAVLARAVVFAWSACSLAIEAWRTPPAADPETPSPPVAVPAAAAHPSKAARLPGAAAPRPSTPRQR
jgi:uncharacterized membrane protein